MPVSVMRIVHFIWRMNLGGAERQLVQLCSGLVGQGIDVHVVTAFSGYCDEQLVATGVMPHRFRTLTKFDVTLIPRTMLLLRRLRPDVVTTWLTQMDIVAGLAASAARVPWILCERSVAESYPPSLLHALRARVGRRALAIVANSEGGRDYWRPFVRDDRVRVIPNIVPMSEIDRAAPAVDGVCTDDDVILYVGRFSAEKNLDRLIDALAIVLPGRRAKAVLCGDGVLRGAIEEKTRSLGLADRVLFLGRLADVFSWMKRATVVVAVGLYEGNPNTALEAMACGAPLVVSDIAPYRALVGDHGAWRVDPLAVESIAAGIAAALDQRSEANSRAKRAHALVGAHSADDIAARYIDVFESVIASRA